MGAERDLAEALQIVKPGAGSCAYGDLATGDDQRAVRDAHLRAATGLERRHDDLSVGRTSSRSPAAAAL